MYMHMYMYIRLAGYQVKSFSLKLPYCVFGGAGLVSLLLLNSCLGKIIVVS